MRFCSLSDWLSWQETQHPKAIDLGLERCNQVAERMELKRASFPIVTVAGTNGKGSAVAILESILCAAGYQTGAYTSPHLVRYNERIRVNGKGISDEAIVAAFQTIDQTRGSISLTYFEFATLAAMEIFRRAQVDAAILEVGMGGRLDAVNIFNANVALVTTVDIDHVQWLGKDRESIAREKAGIFRTGRPAVYGDLRPPISLVDHAHNLCAPLSCLGRDFSCAVHGDHWDWRAQGIKWQDLPRPGLTGTFQIQNAAAVLMVVKLLADNSAAFRIPLSAVRRGLGKVQLPGRFQILRGRVERILDVAHNPQAARALTKMLRERPCRGRTFAVLAMLADKDIQGVITPMMEVLDAWYVASLNAHRGASGESVAQAIVQTQASQPVRVYQTVSEAYLAAVTDAAVNDKVVVFGSFYTVGEVLRLELQKER